MAGNIDFIFNNIVSAVGRNLSKFGFKKSGSYFRLIVDKNAAIIEFQKSRSSTIDRILFTVNVSIVCGILLESESLTIQKCRAVDGHLRDRIGTFLPDRQDKWWEINSGSDPNTLSNELSNTLSDLVVPYLLRYIDTYELLALWESGRAPGLTEGARVRRLEALKHLLDEGKT